MVKPPSLEYVREKQVVERMDVLPPLFRLDTLRGSSYATLLIPYQTLKPCRSLLTASETLCPTREDSSAALSRV